INLAVKLRRDQRPESCPITLRCMSAVRASRAPARRQTDLTVVSSSPKCRAKATIIGYGQSKYPGLDGVRLARILALAREPPERSHAQPVYRFLEFRDREYRGPQRSWFVE